MSAMLGFPTAARVRRQPGEAMETSEPCEANLEEPTPPPQELALQLDLNCELEYCHVPFSVA